MSRRSEDLLRFAISFAVWMVIGLLALHGWEAEKGTWLARLPWPHILMVAVAGLLIFGVVTLVKIESHLSELRFYVMTEIRSQREMQGRNRETGSPG